MLSTEFVRNVLKDHLYATLYLVKERPASFERTVKAARLANATSQPLPLDAKAQAFDAIVSNLGPKLAERYDLIKDSKPGEFSLKLLVEDESTIDALGTTEMGSADDEDDSSQDGEVTITLAGNDLVVQSNLTPNPTLRSH